MSHVSIGLPVFNGERYLEEALKAILAQSYSDFELIISDNASTDRTQEICRTYALQDRRICYSRNEENIGAARNFNRVFNLSSGEYFKWAAHDDVIAPDYLSKCVAVLDRDPSIVLCHSKVQIIDEHGKFLSNYEINLDKVGSIKPQDRFGNIILAEQWCLEVFGLMRANILKMTPLIASYVSSDMSLLAELALRGRFHMIPEYLFFSRDHPERSVRALSGLHMRGAWFDPANAGRKVFPRWRILCEYCKCIKRASLSKSARSCCYLHLLHWLAANGNWANMLAEVMVAFVPGCWRVIWQLKMFKQKIFPQTPWHGPARPSTMTSRLTCMTADTTSMALPRFVCWDDSLPGRAVQPAI